MQPEFHQLFKLFDQAESDISACKIILPDQMPQPYRDLLVHSQHMTSTVERFHHGAVKLECLRKIKKENIYARMILLALENSDEVVQFAIVQIDLDCYDKKVQTEILAAKLPLGRILMSHRLNSDITPVAFLEITPTQNLMNYFRLEEARQMYGRVAIISHQGQPAIKAFELLRPEGFTPSPQKKFI